MNQFWFSFYQTEPVFCKISLLLVRYDKSKCIYFHAQYVYLPSGWRLHLRRFLADDSHSSQPLVHTNQHHSFDTSIALHTHHIISTLLLYIRCSQTNLHIDTNNKHIVIFKNACIGGTLWYMQMYMHLSILMRLFLWLFQGINLHVAQMLATNKGC